MPEITREYVEELLRLAEAWTPWQMGDIESEAVVNDRHWVVHRRMDNRGFTVKELREIVTARTALPALCRALLEAWDSVEEWLRLAEAARKVLRAQNEEDGISSGRFDGALDELSDAMRALETEHPA